MITETWLEWALHHEWEVRSDWRCVAGRRAPLGTALSGPRPSPGSTASASSTMTATIWPRLKRRRTTCSSTGQLFIPYPLHWQGPAWSPMLVSCLDNFCNICSFTINLQTEHSHTTPPNNAKPARNENGEIASCTESKRDWSGIKFYCCDEVCWYMTFGPTIWVNKI